MDLTIKPSIDKNKILSKVSEETIFCYYCGISSITKKLVLNPTRRDHKVTCGFMRSKSGTLLLHDFATGEFYNCFSLVMALYSCNFYKALEIIATDFGLYNYGTSKIVIKEIPKFEQKETPTSIQIEMSEFTDSDLKWWEQYGITKKTLNKYRVFSCNSVFLNGNVASRKAQHNPIYGYYFGKKNGLEQWKIYFPKRKEFRFMNNLSTKTVQGYNQLPKSGNLLIITKSQKDCMTLYELGLPAVSPSSETSFIPDKIYEELKTRFKHIVLLYDNDYTGVCFSNKIRKQHPELYVYFIPRNTGSKDISDFRRDYGRDKTIALIKQGINHLKRKLNEVVQHSS